MTETLNRMVVLKSALARKNDKDEPREAISHQDTNRVDVVTSTAKTQRIKVPRYRVATFKDILDEREAIWIPDSGI